MKTGTAIPAVLAILLSIPGASRAEELMVYTSRNIALLQPVLAAYGRESGVKVGHETGKAEALIDRILSEGSSTEADLLITTDAGSLWRAAEEGLLETLADQALLDNVPGHMRDPQGRWFGISARARTIVYSTIKVKPAELSTYEDLAREKWRGRLCLRSAKSVYNKSLVAMLIADKGADEAEAIVGGWVNNLGKPPQEKDRPVMLAIEAGMCDVGIVNTYYYGRLMRKNPSRNLALFWPDQDGLGVYLDVSGAGIVKHSRNKEEALRFLVWLTGNSAQRLFADSNLEYPVNPEVGPHPDVESWGDFKPNTGNLGQSGKLREEATELMKRVGYQ